MAERIAIIGAGVSGLTCGVMFAERGYRTAIFAKETGRRTTSAAAAAVWFPYHVEPAERVIPLALETYKVLVDLAQVPGTGVSIIELHQFSRTGEIQIPDWAIPLGASLIPGEIENGAAGEAATWTGRPEAERTGSERIKSRCAGFKLSPRDPSTPLRFAQDDYCFAGGFSLRVPLTDTTIYLDYLAARFRRAGGEIHANVHFDKLEEVDREFDLVINCAGIGARQLAQDFDLEPHRGQVAIVPRIEGLSCAIVCDDAPLMYAIPRTNDCVFGRTNGPNDNRASDLETTQQLGR